MWYCNICKANSPGECTCGLRSILQPTEAMDTNATIENMRGEIDRLRAELEAAKAVAENWETVARLLDAALSEKQAAPVPPAAVPDDVAKARCSKCGGADYAAHETYCADHPDNAILAANKENKT